MYLYSYFYNDGLNDVNIIPVCDKNKHVILRYIRLILSRAANCEEINFIFIIKNTWNFRGKVVGVVC